LKLNKKEEGISSNSTNKMFSLHDDTGVVVIKKYLETLISSPGVYRMINKFGDVLYVGKAKNLKKRVTSYTNLSRQSVRIQRMISITCSMEFITTHTEAEALLLESNLIKRFMPRYNILLRDDKMFPFILVKDDHDYPQVLKFRGRQRKKGNYFGPFASVWAVNETLDILQRAFLLRTCSDSVFSNRTRPCLLFQIKRCSGPCVGKIEKKDYLSLVKDSLEFLSAGSQKIQSRLAIKMEKESNQQNYEIAAQYRDRIRALTNIQARQGINISGLGDVDVIGGYQDQNVTCVQIFFFRSGTNYGNRSYFPSHSQNVSICDVFEAFIGQFYSQILPPSNILFSHELDNQILLEQALSVRAGYNVKILVPQRGKKREIIKHALVNAKEAHGRHLAESRSHKLLLKGLANVFCLERSPSRIEVYDNSHISGARAVGVMIVAGSEGFVKNNYRKFTIKGARSKNERAIGKGFSGGDDYAMMREVLTRRFSRVLREDPEKTTDQWPDLVLLDGGKGHLSVAREVFRELGITNIEYAAIAKGVDRNAGRESIFFANGSPMIKLKKLDPVLYFIQRLRDEAHRFAIGSHRKKRSTAIRWSVLDEIPGIGRERKKALLHHFGALEEIMNAGISDLEVVKGVSKGLATKIYRWFQAD